MIKNVHRFIQWLLLIIMRLCRIIQRLEGKVLKLQKELQQRDRRIRKTETERNRLHKETTQLRNLNRAVMRESDSDKAKIDSQQEEIKDLGEQLQEVTKKLKKAADANARLQNRINKNSQNSSLPPSTDQPGRKAANEYNGRVSTGRKPGGQPGVREQYEALSKEDVEELLKNPETIHIVKNCGPSDSGDFKSRYEVDVKVVPVVIETRYYREDKTKGYGIPAQRRSPAVYGSRIKALTAELYVNGVMSNQRIHDLFGQLGDQKLDVSEGSVYNFVRGVSDACDAAYKDIETALMGKRVLYTDSTVLSRSGSPAYIRYIGTNDLGYYVPMDSKSIEALQAIDLLAAFLGILVHDHETAVYHVGKDHAECNVHILRYLRKAGEETGHPWISRMAELLLHGKKMKDESKEHTVPDAVYKDLSVLYDSILKEGFEQNKDVELDSIRQNEKALLNRMQKFKKEHLLFLTDPDVDFSNNLSERALRKGKLRQKMSGGFRKDSGLEMYCRLLTIEHYCRQNHLNSMDVFEKLLDGQKLEILPAASQTADPLPGPSAPICQ